MTGKTQKKRHVDFEIPEEDRKYSIPPAGYVESTLSAGDSNLKDMTINHQLTRIAWDNKWGTRMIRGGNAQRLRTRLSNPEIKKGATHMILHIGGNDMNDLYLDSRTAKPTTIQEQADEAMNHLEEIIEENIENKVETCVMIPAPRGNVSAIFHNKFIGKFKKMVAKHKTVKMVDIQGKSTYDDFVHKKLKPDGVHYTLDTLKRMIYMALTELDLKRPNLDANERLMPKDYLPAGVCSICGEWHDKYETDCDQNRVRYCKNCGQYNHNHRVCLFKAIMCSHCGQRGHSIAKCGNKH